MKKTRKRKALSLAETQRLLRSESPIPVGHLPVDPVGMKAIARIVRERLVSHGGRPSDPEWTITRKVPMRPGTWKELERLADSLRGQNVRVSPGQVAAMALERGLPTGEQSALIFGTVEHGKRRIVYSFSAAVRTQGKQVSQAIAKHGLWSCE